MGEGLTGKMTYEISFDFSLFVVVTKYFDGNLNLNYVLNLVILSYITRRDEGFNSFRKKTSLITKLLSLD